MDAGYHAQSGALVSQRTLWAGNSLEEVVGADTQKLSNHFYWTWYDEQSPGYKNWVLVSNPTANPVYYRINVAAINRSQGQIAPGANVTPRFPGIMGGPVDVETWSDAVGGSVPAYVMASQRVLMSGDTAFNEVPGIPAGELASNYYWTWYDMQSPGASNWVLIANPTGSGHNIYYEIKIPGSPVASGGPIAAGSSEARTFAGVTGGPVQVSTYLDVQHIVPANSIASQRVLWGPSFEEVPGTRSTAIGSDYHWTWYDMQSPGVSNWVLIANPAGGVRARYVIRIGGDVVRSGLINPGSIVTPTFENTIGGPVRVTTTRDVFPVGAPSPSIASQRVLWNGYFNEVTGATLQ